MCTANSNIITTIFLNNSMNRRGIQRFLPLIVLFIFLLSILVILIDTKQTYDHQSNLHMAKYAFVNIHITTCCVYPSSILFKHSLIHSHYRCIIVSRRQRMQQSFHVSPPHRIPAARNAIPAENNAPTDRTVASLSPASPERPTSSPNDAPSSASARPASGTTLSL